MHSSLSIVQNKCVKYKVVSSQNWNLVKVNVDLFLNICGLLHASTIGLKNYKIFFQLCRADYFHATSFSRDFYKLKLCILGREIFT